MPRPLLLSLHCFSQACNISLRGLLTSYIRRANSFLHRECAENGKSVRKIAQSCSIYLIIRVHDVSSKNTPCFPSLASVFVVMLREVRTGAGRWSHPSGRARRLPRENLPSKCGAVGHRRNLRSTVPRMCGCPSDLCRNELRIRAKSSALRVGALRGWGQRAR